MLIVKPIPQIDESPSSVFMRAAHLNGLDKPRELLQLKDKNGDEPLKRGLSLAWRSPQIFNQYLDALGIDLPSHRIAYSQEKTLEGIRVYFDEDIYLPSLVFRLEGNAVCPQCLAEAPYLRKIWSLKLLDICRVHHCDLITACPVCDEELTWHRHSPEICSCGTDLSSCETTTQDAGDSAYLLEAIEKKHQYLISSLSDQYLQAERRRQRERRRR